MFITFLIFLFRPFPFLFIYDRIFEKICIVQVLDFYIRYKINCCLRYFMKILVVVVTTHHLHILANKALIPLTIRMTSTCQPVFHPLSMICWH